MTTSEANSPVADPRVAAATVHWMARFVTNGVDLGTFQATLARIDRWEQWCEQWSESGREFERMAAAAEAADNRVTAGQAWLRAALCYHFGKFVFMDDLRQQRAASDRTIECFARGMWTLEPPAERVEIPYRPGIGLPALLRRPAGVVHPPVVIMVPGL
ncbi:MAG: alpha/beta hydrolase family protein, partial [Candidatus Dormibacteraceae bacterium]